jgi:nucleoside-triphosphatase THEP1
MVLNPSILIVHGAIGSGKSMRAQQISDRAKVNGYKIYGVISKRVIKERKTIGYDGFFPNTGETIQMVYNSKEVSGNQWRHLKGPYVYNEFAFQKANDNLIEAAHLMDKKTLVIADEFGDLETRGFGLYPGIVKVLDAISRLGKLLIICRSNRIDNVLHVLSKGTKVLILRADRSDFWDSLRDSFI